MKHLVCGLGSIGKRHLENLVQLVGRDQVCGMDIDDLAAGHVRDKYSVNVLSDLNSGLAWKPDMVWISSPNHLHMPIAHKVIENSNAHLFIEKPVSDSLSSALSLMPAFRKRPRLIWVACNMRFHPGVTTLKRAFDERMIGRAIVIRIHFAHFLPNWRPGQDYRATYSAKRDQGGGIILDDIHDLDLANWFGGPVKSLFAVTAQSGFLETDVEEIASINLIHENGIFTSLYMDYLRRDKSRGIEIIGEKGTLTWLSKGKRPEMIRVEFFDATKNSTDELFHEEFDDPDVELRLQRDSVIAAIKKPEIWQKKLQSGLASLALAEVAKRSAEKGVWINEPLRDIDIVFR